jgi:phytoene dehydrogenase-like protein
MPTWVYIVGGVIAVVAPTLTAVALLKRAPAENRKINVETVDVNVKIAGDLRDDALSDRQQARADLAQLRSDFEAYKQEIARDRALERAEWEDYRQTCDARMAELAEELATERREKVALAEENGRLLARVSELESEVRDLKSRR